LELNISARHLQVFRFYI